MIRSNHLGASRESVNSIRARIGPSPLFSIPRNADTVYQKAADVWKKDVWDFQAFSQTSLELRFALGYEGKDGKNLNSQTWPGTPRRPSPRHPRPPDTGLVTGAGWAATPRAPAPGATPRAPQQLGGTNKRQDLAAAPGGGGGGGGQASLSAWERDDGTESMATGCIVRDGPAYPRSHDLLRKHPNKSTCRTKSTCLHVILQKSPSFRRTLWWQNPFRISE